MATEHPDVEHEEEVVLPDVKPRHYWDHTPSRRAVPQWDPAALAKKYLDDMERGGRLHNQRKNEPE